MKINSFFKILNRKINKYDKIATNPFCRDKKMIIIWVEESNEEKLKADFGDETYKD